MKVELNQHSSLNKNNEYEPVFRFFQQAGLGADTPYEEVELRAKQFLDETGEGVLQAIKESNYKPKNDLFEFSEVGDSYEKYNWFYGFQNFYRALNNSLKNYRPKSLNDEGAEPQYVLTKEAFKVVGHNAPVIKHSKSSYSSLFPA